MAESLIIKPFTANTVLLGTNAAGDTPGLRVNANNQLQVEIVNAAHVQVDPIVLTTSNVAVFNPGSTASEVYDVRFLISNSGTALCSVSVGVDLGGGTTLDRVYWDGYSVPPEETTGWQYLGRISGDDDIIAANATAATVVATMFFQVNRLD